MRRHASYAMQITPLRCEQSMCAWHATMKTRTVYNLYDVWIVLLHMHCSALQQDSEG
jgi:hypothetical protein